MNHTALLLAVDYARPLYLPALPRSGDEIARQFAFRIGAFRSANPSLAKSFLDSHRPNNRQPVDTSIRRFVTKLWSASEIQGYSIRSDESPSHVDCRIAVHSARKRLRAAVLYHRALSHFAAPATIGPL